MRSDRALVLAAARGDDAAFATLVARHRPRLVRYATGRCGRDTAQAEDAVQDALVRAHRAICAGKVPQDVQAWLFAIVRNRCADLHRSAKPVVALPAELPAGAPSAHELVERDERVAFALDAVGRLPTAQRTALVGRELEGRSYEELAERQATTVGAIKSLLHRARTTLTHQASLPALAPFFTRLRPSQVALSVVDHAGGAAALATVTLAGASAFGSIEPPARPAAPTPQQAHAALHVAAKAPAPTTPPPACPTDDQYDAQYSGADC